MHIVSAPDGGDDMLARARCSGEFQQLRRQRDDAPGRLIESDHMTAVVDDLEPRCGLRRRQHQQTAAEQKQPAFHRGAGVLGSNGHRSATPQRQHSGLRALQT
ncbi:hypothetical protein GALL_496950 [mine drainage metagenome]|uniref:Uncharacterized protein n=1 Tax=mine drainage metagenome TaxID=410659 RepID=A0A1J5PTU8_9ZZZZ